MPKRIQRRRTKGWRMPDGAIFVGRSTMWGNPYRTGDYDPMMFGRLIGQGDVVRMFEWYAADRLQKEPRWLDELRGHDLVCWCPPDQKCHADILLAISNS